MTGGSARARVLLLALGWGELIGTIAGAVAGTAIAPGLGTFYGAMAGALAAVAPSVAGAIALWLAARPGTSPESFRARVRWILLVIATAIGSVVVWLATSGEWDEPIVGPVLVGCAVAVALLPRAHRSISATEPGPLGAPRGPERTALALLLALVFGSIGWFAWRQYLGPDATDRRAAVGERDRLGRLMGLGDLYGYDLDRGVRRTECRRPGTGGDTTTTGYLSYGTGRQEYGDLDDAREAVGDARRDLEDRGYLVSTEDRPQGSWVYGVRGDRSVTIRGPKSATSTVVDLPDDGSIEIRVADGCPDPQPVLEVAPGEEHPRLLAAGVAPASGVEGLACPDGRPASLVTVLASGWLGRDGDRAGAWTVTIESGATVQPCDLAGSEDASTVHGLVVPVADDDAAAVRVEVLVDAGDDEGDAALPPMRASVEVGRPGDAARAIVAELPTSDASDLPPQDLTSCPAGTVQGVVVRWDRPLLQADDVDGDLARTASPEEEYRVTLERGGRTRTVVPVAVDGVTTSASRYVNATGQLLCLDEPGRPVRVRGAASEQLDLGGPPTEAFDLAIPRP